MAEIMVGEEKFIAHILNLIPIEKSQIMSYRVWLGKMDKEIAIY